MQRVDRCRCCAAGGLRRFFDLGELPFANALVEPEAAAAGPDARHPLSLSWCPECSLVQLDHTADPEALFGEYVWVTGTSSTAVAYADIFRQRAMKRLGGRASGQLFVMEAASNDGTFLRPFLQAGCHVLGIDPARNIAEAARKSGIPTRNAFFGEAVAREAVEEHGLPDIVIARNVMPHVAALHDFTEGLRVALEGGGILAAEVHYAGVILENLHYDSIYHEHLCYFTLRSFEALLERHGIHAFDLETSPISGGSLVVFASLERRERSPRLRTFAEAEKRAGTNNLGRWEGFARTAGEHRNIFREMLAAELERGRALVGYGASARSSTLMNFCGIGPGTLPVIADQNPLKQGLLTAGNRIPVAPPAEAMGRRPDTVVVLAWNFLDEITAVLSAEHGFSGKILAPLPHPPKLYDISEVTRG